MKNKIKKRLIELFLITFFVNLLFFSKESVELASKGLLIWYKNMIPTLFPFMVLSGFLVRTGMAAKLSKVFYPALRYIFPATPSMLYAIVMGFLCGFPMGAKVVSDLLESRQITPRQGEYLLAFCNNIGPLYMLGYVIPLFGWKNIFSIFTIMYGVPLIYGYLLSFLPSYRMLRGQTISTERSNAPSVESYGSSFQASLENSIQQISMLGGCMVFFNCLQIYPNLLRKYLPYTIRGFYDDFLYAPLCCLMEIGGGLEKLMSTPIASTYMGLCYLTIGGLCCIIQTCFIIKETPLKLEIYIRHKMVQTLLVFGLLLLL